MITYNLDTVHSLKINGLIFKDSFSTLQVDTQSFLDLPLERQISIIDDVLKELAWIDRQGYLTVIDLTTFPIIAELLPSFITGNNDFESIEFINGKESMESYKWIYNIVILSLYWLCLLSLHSIPEKELESDVATDFKVKERELFAKIDSSIRHHMRKKGISLVQNVYSGFDTEYKNVEINKNRMVSTQLAVCTGINVKIPKSVRYSISNLDVEKNSLNRVKKSSKLFNYAKVEASIHHCIQRIKEIKYGNYDESMMILNNCFKHIKGLNCYEGEEYNLYSLPNSMMQPFITMRKRVSLKYLLKVSSNISRSYLEQSVCMVVKLLKDIASKGLTTQYGLDKLSEEINKYYGNYAEIENLKKDSEKQLPYFTEDDIESRSKNEKRLERLWLTDIINQGKKLSVTITKYYYIVAHLSHADLSLLTDFELIKEELSIVNGSFITLRDPLKYEDKNVHIRDTMLLAPGGAKSLGKIGKLYGEDFNKIKIGSKELEDMLSFSKSDRDLFILYALRDALITLKHSLWMVGFNFTLGGVGLPLTLSSIGRKYVKQIWKESKYSGYQISQSYHLGDVSTSITPKGLNTLAEVGLVLPFYIANYKGGRNECFMYGIDRDEMWYDYDLTNAYTTVMSMAGHPDYKHYQRLSEEELNLLSDEEVLYSYLIIQTDFEFPTRVKYPSIPCYVDENCTIYPLKGTGIITGSEYLLAKWQGCKLWIKNIHFIPFSKSDTSVIKPFEQIITIIQEKRREYPKGSISNYMYKEIGNSIYGSVVRGMSNKKKFDIKTKTTQRVGSDDIANPLIASWTTAFVRSVIGECLNTIQNTGGLVVSVTTDGFITNLDNVEARVSHNFLVREYKKIREKLSGNDAGLELKHSGRGLLAWTTRGQLGFESKIIATTGFQHFYEPPAMIKVLTETFNSDSKDIEFIQSRLRSAKEIYTKGGHVTMVYKDQHFRMHFDNKRVLEQRLGCDVVSEVLIDSKPVNDIKQGENLRFISKLTKIKQYSRFSNTTNNSNRYLKNEDLAITNFVKALLTEPPMFNLHRRGLESYQDIVNYIKTFKPEKNVSLNSIALLKRRSLKWRSVPRLKQTEEFIQYIKIKFKDFDEDSFFRV